MREGRGGEERGGEGRGGEEGVSLWDIRGGKLTLELGTVGKTLANLGEHLRK